MAPAEILAVALPERLLVFTMAHIYPPLPHLVVALRYLGEEIAVLRPDRGKDMQILDMNFREFCNSTRFR